MFATAWGDIPTWIGAIGTLLAFTIALWIYAQSQRDRRRAQARHVSGWVPGGVSLVPAGMQLGASPLIAQQPTVQFMIKICNGSDDLISDVTALVTAADGVDLGVAPVGWTDIGPGQVIELTSSFADTGQVRGELRLRLTFTDSAARRWERFGGDLRRVSAGARNGL